MSNRILIASSRYYEPITRELEAGANEALAKNGESAELIIVPGVFEVPGVIAMAADSGKFDGYIALGCVIRGETSHYDYVCSESARGLMDLVVSRRLAIGNGILTVENIEQAEIRAGRDKKNKGRDAALACLAMLTLRRRFVG